MELFHRLAEHLELVGRQVTEDGVVVGHVHDEPFAEAGGAPRGPHELLDFQLVLLDPLASELDETLRLLDLVRRHPLALEQDQPVLEVGLLLRRDPPALVRDQSLGAHGVGLFALEALVAFRRRHPLALESHVAEELVGLRLFRIERQRLFVRRLDDVLVELLLRGPLRQADRLVARLERVESLAVLVDGRALPGDVADHRLGEAAPLERHVEVVDLVRGFLDHHHTLDDRLAVRLEVERVGECGSEQKQQNRERADHCQKVPHAGGRAMETGGEGRIGGWTPSAERASPPGAPALECFRIGRPRRSDSASIVRAGTPAQGEPPGEPTGPRPLRACSRSGDPGSAFGPARWRALPHRSPAAATASPRERLGGGRFGAFSGAVALAQVVLLHLALQREAADAERLGGLRLVAVGDHQRLADLLHLHRLHQPFEVAHLVG